MQNILLLNAVAEGGATYTEYLKYVAQALHGRHDLVSYNIPSRTKLTAKEAEAIIGVPVEDIEYSDISAIKSSDFSQIMTNEAYIGNLIDPDIVTTFIAHGSCSYPANSIYFFSEYLAYFDVLTISARSTQQAVTDGMTLYRDHRLQGKLGPREGSVRSDIRSTWLMPTLPVKFANRLQQPVTEIPPEEFTIGLIPSGVTAMQPLVTMYRNIASLVETLTSSFPKCKVVFRPYPVDFKNPQVQELCSNLANKDRVSVCLPDVLSSDFYEECDLVITDGSTGGSSFLLRKAVPPIYFIPEDSLVNSVTVRFVNSMRYVPFSHTFDDLVKKIRVIVDAGPEILFSIYNEFVDNEFFPQRDQRAYFDDIVAGNWGGQNSLLIDSYGDVSRHGSSQSMLKQA